MKGHFWLSLVGYGYESLSPKSLWVLLAKGPVVMLAVMTAMVSALMSFLMLVEMPAVAYTKVSAVELMECGLLRHLQGLHLQMIGRRRTRKIRRKVCLWHGTG
jgi:hypothetical protein